MATLVSDERRFSFPSENFVVRQAIPGISAANYVMLESYKKNRSNRPDSIFEGIQMKFDPNKKN